MSTSFAALHACCPLCGSPVLSISRSGRVLDADPRPLQLGPRLGRGYSLCDVCRLLADLPGNLTLN